MSDRIIDLRTPEIVLLRRALLMYAKTYQELMLKSEQAWEKEELKKYIAAAGRLGERLLKETRLKDGFSPQELAKIRETVKAHCMKAFSKDEAQSQREAERIIQTLQGKQAKLDFN